MSQIVLAGRPVGLHHPPFVVAEAGINHNGDLERARAMIRLAKAAGADAVKFQTFRARELVADARQTFTYRSQGRDVTESMLEMFERCEFRPDEWRSIAEACAREEIVFLSTPQNWSDLETLLPLGIPAIKVGSDDFVNRPLLARFAQTGLPLILSIGMSDLEEVRRSLDTVGAQDGYPVALLLCTSEYPTPAQDVHVLKLTTLQQQFPSVVLGFSDHTRGCTAAVVALALGARVFEKHFTLDRDLPGPDHEFSADPEELRAWVRTIREAWTMLGNSAVVPTAAELGTRSVARRFLVAACDIEAGETLCAANVTALRVEGGILPAAVSIVSPAPSRRERTVAASRFARRVEGR